MKFKTRFGDIEVNEDSIITFQKGLPGFENLKKFVITSQNTDPIMWLVSLEDENVALPVINPWLIRFDYDVKLPEGVVNELEIEEKEEVEVWTILTIPEGNPENMTVNLLAPIVINKKKRLGEQVVLEDSEYGLRHSVKEEMERSRKIMEELKEKHEVEKNVVKVTEG